MNLERDPRAIASSSPAGRREGEPVPVPQDAPAPYRQAAEEVTSRLASDFARGLSRAEARQRLEQYGPNQLKSAPETPWWRRMLEQFQNFLVIILLIATV